ncbi:xylulokinase [Acrocarpospora corrugata]|uniref:Xylulokinase n=1 Tax=Acrocarpospora corrugata TaxID=35763 RepID=A0A5M3W032_9ACTN|nr:FGGY family carbohydrate kinase [Acrocarpospora corrugata]GES00653.1 xylulokinase [Acrocarpospora corrugata]
MRILAFDVGTSGVKAVVTDTEGRLLDSAFCSYGLRAKENGWVDQDLDDILTATRHVGRTLADRNAGIGGVSVTAQMFNLVPVDPAGRPLLPMLSWLDQRSAGEAAALAARMPPDLQFERLGAVVSAKDILPKILWLRDREPEVFGRAFKLLDCKEAVVMWLTGRAVVDHAGASAYRLYDQVRRDWDWPLCQELGIPVQLLPEIRRATDLAGTILDPVAEQLGLPPGVPVVVGAGDVPASQAGSGAVGSGDVHVSLGTAIYFGVTMDQPGRDPARRLGALAHVDSGRWILWLEIATGGAALAWIARTLGLDPEGRVDYDRVDRLVAGCQDQMQDLIFAPWLSGERVPVFDDHARAAFVGLGLAHGPAHLLRAVMEGVAFQMRWALEYGHQFGQDLATIRAVGGGTIGTQWLQIIADILGRPLHTITNPQDAGAIGAAACALVALGHWPDFTPLKARATIDTTYQPDPARAETYTRRYATYLRLYEALHPLYHRETP